MAVPIPFCRDDFILHQWGIRSSGMSSIEVIDGFGELVKSESVLVKVSIGGHACGQFIVRLVTDGQNGYLGEAIAHHLKKLTPWHSGHVEVGDD